VLLVFVLASPSWRDGSVLAEPRKAAGRAAVSLFAFDDHAITFKRNLKLTLVEARKYPGNPVVARGPAGSVDHHRAQFYGSVLRMEGRYRMWYAACSDDRLIGGQSPSFRIAYAESRDGLRWTKPELGLTEFNGNKRNNLVGMPPELDMTQIAPLACFVLHEPDERDPSRRYKMAVYGNYRRARETKRTYPTTIYPFFSADGLRWRLAVPPPRSGGIFTDEEAPIVSKHGFEIGGLYRFDGIYYAPGQQITPDVTMPDGSPAMRTMVTFWSGDFVTWSRDKSFAFQRYGFRPAPQGTTATQEPGTFELYGFRQRHGEETHEPIGAWNRGNVLFGLYGLWHGAADRSKSRMDLGFLVSNDGIHFREPVADFPIIRAGADGEWDRHGLIHGQGYENVGDQTYIYYGTWDLSFPGHSTGAIGVAMLRRDGFGYLSSTADEPAQFTTAPLVRPAAGGAVYVNADGLSEDAFLRVEVIDPQGKPVAGYSGAKAAVVRQSGVRVKLDWSGRSTLAFPESRFRLRATFEGKNAGSIKFYAAYVE
jgi:hypothetical protein